MTSSTFSPRGAILLVLCAIALSCLPTVENLTKRHKLTPDVADCLGPTQQVLVLPLWYDDGACHFRDPVILPEWELPQLHAHIPSRYRFGSVDFMGHGPSHSRSMHGIALVSQSGTVLWLEQEDVTHEEGELTFYWRPGQVAPLTPDRLSGLIHRLLGEFSSEADLVFFPDDELMCHDVTAKGLSENERDAVVAFLVDSRSDHKPSDAGWAKCGAAP